MRKVAAGLAAVLLVAAALGVGVRTEAADAAPAAPAAMGGTRITDVFIRTSVHEKRARLDIEVTGARNAGLVNLTARMLNEAGQEETVFVKTMRIEARDVQVVTVLLAWPAPRLWDLGQPNLYTMKLKAAGAGLDQEVTQEFGFRELEINGRDFILNGTKVHLRPAALDPVSGLGAPLDQRIDQLMGQGFNVGEVWPHSGGDYAAYNDGAGRQADRKGFAVIGVLPDIDRTRDYQDPKERAAYEEKLAKAIKAARNHPSILMWNTSANLFHNGRDLDPRLIGQRDWAVDRETVVWNLKGLDVLRLVKEYDPTRPAFAFGGGYVGDVYTMRGDLDFLPLQEREDWLSAWAGSGHMPVMAVDFHSPRWTLLQTSRPNGLVATEWAAAEFGSGAYRKETPEYRAAITKQEAVVNEGDFVRKYLALHRSSAVADLEQLFYKNTWRAWRAWGLSGGPAPFDEYGTTSGLGVPPEELKNDLDRVKPFNGPALAWIAGAARDGFTSKDHSYRAGDRVAKQIVLINDDRKAQPFTISWTGNLAGALVGQGSDKGMLKPGEILFLPIEFPLPEKIAGEKDTGAIHLTATIGEKQFNDEFALRVFAPPPECKVAAAVFDPAGETTAMLKALGVGVQPMAQKLVTPPPAGSLVIVGRRAMSDMHTIPFDVDAFVKNGGRLLVMTQDRLWMRQGLGLRTAEPLMRQVFLIDPAHPVAAGLDDIDLADWAGVSKLMPDSTAFSGLDPWWPPSAGWHWGNRGAVTSAAVEKPHRTSWRPILECGFDLAYSPLMEMDYGRGRVTLCMLDLEDHVAADPAARRLAVNVLNYVATAPLAPKAQKVIYAGDEVGAALLDAMGVEYAKAGDNKAEMEDKGAGLVILGHDAGAAGDSVARALAFAQRGGRVLVLWRPVDFLEAGAGSWGDHTVAAVEKQENFAGSLKPPAWAETRGLSASDLRWRADHRAWLIKGGPGVEVGADGLMGRIKTGDKGGEILFCQIDPTGVPATELLEIVNGRSTGIGKITGNPEKSYFRITRWRQTRALAQVLANLGATFKQDRRQIQLLQQPDFPVYLAGTWDAKLTKGVAEILPAKAIDSFPITNTAQQLARPDAPTGAFEHVYVPSYMQAYGPGWEGKNGEAVFRRVVVLPESLAGRDLVLSLGRVGESETTFFNGQKVGESEGPPPSWPGAGKVWGGPGSDKDGVGIPADGPALRTHVIPGKFVKAGRNVLVVRVFNAIHSGGLCGQPSEMFLAPKSEPTRFYHDDYREADDPYRYFRW